MEAPVPRRIVAAIEEADRCIDQGQALEDQRDFRGALACYQHAIALAPDHVRGHMNAGNALANLGRWNEALEAQRSAVRHAPTYAPARFNLGAFLFNRGQLAAASAELLVASTLQPGMKEAPLLLAEIHELEERFGEAEREYRRALAIAPQHAGTLVNFGWFCVRQGRMKEAFEFLQRASTLDPSLAIDGQILFAMNFQPDLSPEHIADEHRRRAKLISESAGVPLCAWANTADPARRLRVAYVSGDFGPHPVAFFMRPILQHHDRSKFEVFAYSNSPQSNPVEPSLQMHADHWRVISNLSDAEAVDRICADRIDVLVDLSGHTSRGRLGVFARHPAPVQVTWLGYLNTTGLAAMDYRIVDRHTDPEGMTEHLHSERLVRMPHSQWCYFAWEEIEPVTKAHPERPDAIVFGSFNQYAKITDCSIALWSRVLLRVPHAELVVFDVRHSSSGELLVEKMRQAGIDPARVTLRGREPVSDYFRALGNVDIALDTFPYNGATTTFDALWMGVPMVALRGDRGIARGTYSIFRTLAADDLIAASADEFVDINCRLATDSRWRNELRRALRGRLAASPLMDAPAFTRALEDSYRKMWEQWCSGPETGA
jgi:protein O-GlcNAc transferase